VPSVFQAQHQFPHVGRRYDQDGFANLRT
jgi:hypothetical protein